MTTKKLSTSDAAARLGLESPEIIGAGDDTLAIETVADTDLATLARSEVFMNELIRIRVQTTTDPNASAYAVVTVNDVNNRVIVPRGTPVWVKRMHVEVLARMRETRFNQRPNPNDPEAANQLHEQHAMVYPFEVLDDKNPAGREWLEMLYREPA